MPGFIGMVILRHVAIGKASLVLISQLPNLVGVLIQFVLRLAHIHFQIGRGRKQNDFDHRLLGLFGLFQPNPPVVEGVVDEQHVGLVG